jgi:hypothetical protein
MSDRNLIRDLPRDTRTQLCEELIEIILGTKKDNLPNELVSNILGCWKNNQLITTENTLNLLQQSYEFNAKVTRMLLLRLGLNQLTETFEAKARIGG